MHLVHIHSSIMHKMHRVQHVMTVMDLLGAHNLFPWSLALKVALVMQV